MEAKAEKLAMTLFDIGAVKFGAFKLKLHEKQPDAPLSPIYIDLRIIRSFPDVLDMVVEAFKELTRGLKFDVYADVPTAATPIVAVLSHEARVPMISPRKEEKGRGVSGKIDGVFQSGQVAVLIDDLITQADSKLEAIAALKENGVMVKDVVVLVDREQGGREQLEKGGYRLHTLFRLPDMLKLYFESGRITETKYHETLGYLKANK